MVEEITVATLRFTHRTGFQFSFPTILLLGLATFPVTDADAAGPIPIKTCQTISEPGSYELKNNLSITENQPCLVVDADFVTIDLGGYTRAGPGLDSLGSYGLDAYGIRAPELVLGASIKKGVVVRNGTVTGFTYGVFLYPTTDAAVENVRVLNNYRRGIQAGSRATVRNSVASGNNYNDFEGEGIGVGDDSIVQNNTAIENQSFNVYLDAQGCNLDNNVFPVLAP